MRRYSKDEIFLRLRKRERLRRKVGWLAFCAIIALTVFLVINLKRRYDPGDSTPSNKVTHLPHDAAVLRPPKPVLKAAPSGGAERKKLVEGFLRAQIPELEKTLNGFVNAGTVEARLKYVRLPGVVKPYMQEYYDRPQPRLFGKPKALSVEPFQPSGDKFVKAVVSFAGGEPSEVILELNDGRFLLDWENLVNYSVVPWDKFRKDRSIAPVTFRMLAAKGEFYFPPFSDATIWKCLTLKNADSEDEVYAYYRTGSPVAKDIAAILEPFGVPVARRPKQVPLTVQLAYPNEPARPNQVMLENIVSDGWVREAN